MGRSLWDVWARLRTGGGARGGGFRCRRCSPLRLRRCWPVPTICVRFSAGAAASSPRRWRYLALTGRRATPPIIMFSARSTATRSPGHLAALPAGGMNQAISRLTARHCGAAAGSTPRRCMWSPLSPRGCRAVVGDLAVAPDENEITAALALLKDLQLEGAIITGDAIFCQREVCQTITDRQGDYLFVVKDNQPALKVDIAESFGDLSPLALRRRRRSAA